MKRQDYYDLVNNWNKYINIENNINNNNILNENNVIRKKKKEENIFDYQKLFESCLELKREIDLIDSRMLIENNEYLLNNVYRLDEAGIVEKFKNIFKFKKETGEKINPDDDESLPETKNSNYTISIAASMVVLKILLIIGGSIGHGISPSDFKNHTDPEKGAITYTLDKTLQGVTPHDIKNVEKINILKIKDVANKLPDDVKKEAKKSIIKITKKTRQHLLNKSKNAKTGAEKKKLKREAEKLQKKINDIKNENLDNMIKQIAEDGGQGHYGEDIGTYDVKVVNSQIKLLADSGKNIAKKAGFDINTKNLSIKDIKLDNFHKLSSEDQIKLIKLANDIAATKLKPITDKTNTFKTSNKSVNDKNENEVNNALKVSGSKDMQDANSILTCGGFGGDVKIEKIDTNMLHNFFNNINNYKAQHLAIKFMDHILKNPNKLNDLKTNHDYNAIAKKVEGTASHAMTSGDAADL